MVGGFNPFARYESNWMISLGRGSFVHLQKLTAKAPENRPPNPKESLCSSPFPTMAFRGEFLDGCVLGCLLNPRDPGSPKLRMVSWNLNTLRFGRDCTPQSSSDKAIGSLGKLCSGCQSGFVVICLWVSKGNKMHQ